MAAGGGLAGACGWTAESEGEQNSVRDETHPKNRLRESLRKVCYFWLTVFVGILEEIYTYRILPLLHAARCNPVSRLCT